jgi:hypothetical protein
MIKKFVPVLAAAAGSAVLFAGSASAATQSKAHTFGSCHKSGAQAQCTADGTAKHPSSLWMHVRAQPNQRVYVGWAVECFKGSGTRRKHGAFTARATPTLTRRIPMTYKHPGKCIAAASAVLAKKGTIRVWLTVGK